MISLCDFDGETCVGTVAEGTDTAYALNVAVVSNISPRLAVSLKHNEFQWF